MKADLLVCVLVVFLVLSALPPDQAAWLKDDFLSVVGLASFLRDLLGPPRL